MTSHDLDAEYGGRLRALAMALVDQPRATLKDLAAAIGVSRATLYRVYQTREKLIERLFDHAMSVFTEALQKTGLESRQPREALGQLIGNILEHRELHVFLMYYWKDVLVNPQVQAQWEALLDAFFRRGQQQGVFRIDVSAAALTEILISLITGLVDAERRGRIARLELGSMAESIFLKGAEQDRPAA